jgi:hypothetical protein
LTLLERRWWYRTRRDGRPPERVGALYSLTPRAEEMVRLHAMFPLKPRGRGQERLRDHDQTTNTFLASLIQIGRSAGLSGVFVAYEYHLNPPQRRPRVDALIVARLQAGAYPHPDMVPWTRDVGTRGEGRSIRLAVETDRDSEPPSVLRGKGLAYAACARPHWLDRHGHFPTPSWIVPDEARAQQLWTLWQEAWPQGFWRITTDAWLGDDIWNEYFQGETFTRDAGTAVGLLTPVASYRVGTDAYQRRRMHGRLDFSQRARRLWDYPRPDPQPAHPAEGACPL